MIIDNIRHQLTINQLNSDKEDIFDQAIQKIFEYFNRSYSIDEIIDFIENDTSYSTYSINQKLKIITQEKLGCRIVEIVLSLFSELPYEFTDFIEVRIDSEDDPHGNEWDILKLYVYDRESYANKNLKVVDVIKDPEKYQKFFSEDYEPYKILEKIRKDIFPIRRKK